MRNWSHEAAWIRRGVRDGFRWAGTKVLVRQAYTISDFKLGVVNRCPTCFDEVVKQVSNTRCPDCWGTGFEGGYRPPFVTWCSILENVPQDERHQNDGIDFAGDTTIKLPVDRVFRDGDIIAEVRRMENDWPVELGRVFRLDGPVRQQTVQGWVSNDNVNAERRTRLEDILVSQEGPAKLLLPTDMICQNAETFFGLGVFEYDYGVGDTGRDGEI